MDPARRVKLSKISALATASASSNLALTLPVPVTNVPRIKATASDQFCEGNGFRVKEPAFFGLVFDFVGNKRGSCQLSTQNVTKHGSEK
jgi:hypothetical protein